MAFTTNSKQLNDLIKEIGYKHGLSAGQAYEMATHQFTMVKEVIENTDKDDLDTYKSVLITRFGTFDIRSRQKTKLKKIINEIFFIFNLMVIIICMNF